NVFFHGHLRPNVLLQQYKGNCNDVWFDLSINWIKERAAQKEPFFLYLPTNIAHVPHWVAAKYKQPYLSRPAAAGFFGMLANLDENMARLDAALKETGVRDHTILCFMNDNGGTAGVNIYNAGMRG